MYEPIFSISDPVELPDANDPTIPRYKLYDANAVLICSLFGGVLGGCLLMALNYRRMGQKDNAVLVALAGAVVTATAIALGSVIPKGFELPIGIGLFFATRRPQAPAGRHSGWALSHSPFCAQVSARGMEEPMCFNPRKTGQ
jgi:hypothetical protein